MSIELSPPRRPLLSELGDAPVSTTTPIQLHEPPDDPLAAALPEWDLVPATEFLRRR